MIKTVIDAMNSKALAEKFYEKNNIKGVDINKFYPQQAYLDMLRQISDQIGEATLSRIGEMIFENAKWPPGVNTLEKALTTVNDAYKMNHRGGEIGSYKLEKINDRTFKMICDNPYPCAFDLGIMRGIAKKFGPATVRHAEGECRAKGGSKCSYTITV
ncbi:MAG TPA: hypothetical protein VK436_14825 [Methanocella sp.]|nr:hypothetical protein [Methanocella sp.]